MSYDDDSEERGKSKRCRQRTPDLFIICQRSIYTEVSYNVLWIENGLTLISFSRNVKSSGDIRVVLCDIVLIDRLTIKRTLFVREQLRRLSRKIETFY